MIQERPAILFLDDDQLAMGIYVDKLRDRGFDVTHVDRADAAVDLLETRTFDIAVLDLMIAAGTNFGSVASAGGLRTGLAFARLLKNKSSETKIVFLTLIERDNEVVEWCQDNDATYCSKLEYNPRQFTDVILRVEESRHENEMDKTALAKVARLLQRFSDVADQLQRRHANRQTLVIEDEYDVQDLLHSLLLVEFQDVRAEEWTPSYAGSSARVDFLLKDEQIVIEVKLATSKFTERKLGEQLTIDIARYVKHPDCKTLVCFVYDPERALGKRESLRKDLEGLGLNDLRIVVIISP